MTREDYDRRSEALVAEWTELNPAATTAWLGLSFAAFVVRGILHLCVGFGLLESLDWSRWWAPIVALLSAQSIGRFWERSRRGVRLHSLAMAVERARKTKEAALVKAGL
ncbi:MAG: DUF308 domain-containing protein [Myxococcota bacterium]|nr:DUF308 domain-containing protein [Myxococcota bacterium]